MKRVRYYLSVLVLSALVLWGCQTEGPNTQNQPDPSNQNNTKKTDKPEQPQNRQTPPTGRVDPPQPTKPHVQPPPSVEDHWSKADPSNGSKGTLKASFGRYSRRMSVMQLKAVLPQLFKGITWKSGSRNMFDLLSRTLGQADYLQVTQNSRESTSLFMKFMDDMAGQVCKAAVKADRKTQDMRRRSVIRYKDVNKTLRFLRLKFHSIYVPENSTESIKQLRTLYDRVLAKTRKTSTAWEGVCIAVLTAPEFFSY